MLFNTQMKKEFGKWFLDLAKYILTAIALTTLFRGMEETRLVWTTFAAFSVCVLFGYLLLRQSDMDQEQAKNSAVTKVPSEPNKEQRNFMKSEEFNNKKNKKKKK